MKCHRHPRSPLELPRGDCWTHGEGPEAKLYSPGCTRIRVQVTKDMAPGPELRNTPASSTPAQNSVCRALVGGAQGLGPRPLYISSGRGAGPGGCPCREVSKHHRNSLPRPTQGLACRLPTTSI